MSVDAGLWAFSFRALFALWQVAYAASRAGCAARHGSNSVHTLFSTTGGDKAPITLRAVVR